MLLLLCLARPAAAAVAPPDLFPIGVYRQPTTSFDLWKSRGINTVVDFYAPGKNLERWNAAAVAEGLWMVRNPRKNPRSDVNQPCLLAFSHADEPDVWAVPPKKLAAQYRRWKSAAPSIPVIANFAGATVVYQYDTTTDQKYRAYLNAVDWASNDVYPLTQYGRPQWIDRLQSAHLSLNDPKNLSGVPFNPGTAVDKLRELSGGKRQFAYIETSYQNLTGPTASGARGATADEVRGETWDAIIHGAKGIIYFPFTFPGDNDGTPADVAAEMTRTDATIARMAAVLNSNGDDSPNVMTLSGGLEGTWRAYGGRMYYFVLNDSHTAVSGATLTLPRTGGMSQIDVADESRQLALSDGSLTDDFGAYQLHIYVTPSVGAGAVPSTVSLAPEPSSVCLVLLSAGMMLRRPRR
jgi:hypothetical protein